MTVAGRADLEAKIGEAAGAHGCAAPAAVNGVAAPVAEVNGAAAPARGGSHRRVHALLLQGHGLHHMVEQEEPAELVREYPDKKKK